MMQLTEHFSLEELTFSETAARKGLANEPTPVIFDNLKRVAAVLEDIRELVGKPVTVSSGYRSPAVNDLVGGSKSSMHMQGLAADIRVAGMTPRELAIKIVSSHIHFDQLILEYDRWVHVGLSTDALRGQVRTIRTGTGYMLGIV